jgi:hypothetical protein
LAVYEELMYCYKLANDSVNRAIGLPYPQENPKDTLEGFENICGELLRKTKQQLAELENL